MDMLISMISITIHTEIFKKGKSGRLVLLSTKSKNQFGTSDSEKMILYWLVGISRSSRLCGKGFDISLRVPML